MLEGFSEMDALAERGFVPGMSKVSVLSSCLSFPQHGFCLFLLLLD